MADGAVRTDALPAFFVNRVREDLGPFWEHLPDGALRHDPEAYLRAENAAGAATVEMEPAAGE